MEGITHTHIPMPHIYIHGIDKKWIYGQKGKQKYEMRLFPGFEHVTLNTSMPFIVLDAGLCVCVVWWENFHVKHVLFLAHYA